ncbi:DHHC palmitoyltransferase-domain-containing protein [Cercophora scortea]|uniref:Palmitoyltransferase n=1 Tax=Cercophora scortea TaxID=314031 RepID=A0AAE0MHR5_9PEZI|nr:DHHC palmitoyltransferase-domain-containing protein [Cercophora scortea]
MGTLANIALGVLGISFMTFVTFFGRLPIFRRTPIAWLHRLIWILIPNALLSLDNRLTSGRITSSISRFGHIMMYEKHPTVLIFFFLLLSVGEVLYLPTAWPQLNPLQKFTGALAIVLPYIFLYLAAFSDPGAITPVNHAHEMSRYPYDFTIFHPGTACPTCKLLKPARSKHCSLCGHCIGRNDHHCIFINNCVGAGNTHWFLLLLLSTGVLTLYGGLLGMALITAKMRARYPEWALLWWNANAGKGMSLHQWLVVWSWGLQDSGGVAMGSVTLLALLTSPLVWGLLGYHVWLIYCGTTTNETLKWSDWQAEMDDGFAFRRRMAPDRAKDLRVEPAWTRWPAETEQVLVRTQDGRPPPPDTGVDDVPGVGEWEPVWRLKDIENLYDLGFWDNLVDVFVPWYSFRDPQMPVTETSLRMRMKKKRRGR